MPVHKDKKTNTWYFKCCINSTQYLRRGYRTKNEALKNELLFKIEFLDKKQSRNVITFDTGINLYFNYLKSYLKPTTYYNRVLLFKKYIIPNFNSNTDVSEISFSEFNNFRSKILKCNYTDKNRIISNLHSFFEYLERYYHIKNDSVKRIQKIVNFKPTNIEKKETNKPVSIQLFKEYYKKSDFYFKFYLLTSFIFGLRISELRGLSVDSFDLKNNILYINKVTTCKVGLNKSVDLSPKSKSSIRKYYLSISYVKILNAYLKKYKLRNRNRIFFSDKKNSAISESSIRRYLITIEKENNLEHITPHGLRHGIATYLYSVGIPYEDIGKYLGHKFNSVTMDVYIDLTKEKQQNIINKIDKLINELC